MQENWTAESGYIEAQRRIRAAAESNHTTLDLHDLPLADLPPELGQLGGLKELFLGNQFRDPETGYILLDRPPPNKNIVDLSALAGLSALQLLDLGGCRRLSDFSGLAGLSALQHLNLSGCRQLSDLSVLAGLGALRHLNLGGCDRLSDLSVLAGLSALQHLDLGWCDQLSDLSVLAGLSALQHLDLGWCGQLSDLSVLAGLGALRHLNLSGCRQLSDLSVLAGLGALRHLYLRSCDQLSDLSALAGLSALQHLDLGWCGRLSDLSALAGLSALQHLDLWGTSSPTISRGFLQGLKDRCDGLSHLIIQQAVEIHPALLSRSERDNCLERLFSALRAFEDPQAKPVTDQDVKVLVLGNGEIGKTWFCHRLMGHDPTALKLKSTHGIQVLRAGFPQEFIERQFQDQTEASPTNWLNLWDFGGQDLYHGTHALFLNTRSVFLMLWKAGDDEEQERIDSLGHPDQRHTQQYWADYIESLAPRDSAVVVAQSLWRDAETGVDDRPGSLNAEFRHLKPIESYYNASTGEHGKVLKEDLETAIAQIRGTTGDLLIPGSWAKVRDEIQAWQQEWVESEEVSFAERKRQTIPWDEGEDSFVKLCQSAGDVGDPKVLLQFLHDTGVLFHKEGAFQNQIVLDQEFVLKAIYEVLDRENVLESIKRTGRFTMAELWQKTPYSEGDQALFLSLMQECGICFEFRKGPQGESVYVAPDLLPDRNGIDDPDHRDRASLDAWNAIPTPETVYRLDFDFWHQAMARSFFSEVGRAAGDRATYWKNGVYFEVREHGEEAVCRITKEPSRAGTVNCGCLTIRVKGETAGSIPLLAKMIAVVHKIQTGVPPRETLERDGCLVKVNYADESKVDQKRLTLDEVHAEEGGEEKVVAYDPNDPDQSELKPAAPFQEILRFLGDRDPRRAMKQEMMEAIADKDDASEEPESGLEKLGFMQIKDSLQMKRGHDGRFATSDESSEVLPNPSDLVPVTTTHASEYEYDVFISHSDRDLEAAKSLTEFLREKGLTVWLFETAMKPADPWKNWDTAMELSQNLVILLGGHSTGQERELEYFENRQRSEGEETCRILPVLLPGARDHVLFPRFLDRWMWIEAKQEFGVREMKLIASVFTRAEPVLGKRPKRRWIPAVLVLGLTGVVASAGWHWRDSIQDWSDKIGGRGIVVTEIGSDGQSPPADSPREIPSIDKLYQGSHALIIGNDTYQHWSNLPSIVEETKEVQEALKKQGFTIFKGGVQRNLTEDELRRTYEDFIDDHGLADKNRLVLYFAGHGFTRKNGDIGYIVPVDAPNPNDDETGFTRKAVEMDAVRTWMRKIESHHALFLFDSCFSGTAFLTRSLTNEELPSDIAALAELPVRQFMTSGSADEEVPARSVFTQAFVDAMTRPVADLDDNGYVIGAELAIYLRKEVAKFTPMGNRVQYGVIRDRALSQGDIVFEVLRD